MRAALAFAAAAVAAVILWFVLTADEQAPAADPPPVDVTGERVARAPGVPQLTVRVVHHGTEEPIADAEIGFYALDQGDQNELGEAEQQGLSRRDPEFFRALDQVRTTDAAGECAVPRPTGAITVAGWHGELFGTITFRTNRDQRPVLALRPDHRLRVRVLESSGAPAVGVDVVMTPRLAKKKWRLRGTDEDGVIVVPHSQKFVGDATTCPVNVYAVGHGVASEGVEVDLLQAPEVTVDLRLPPTGTMTFELVRADRRPYTFTDLDPPGLSLSLHQQEPSNRIVMSDGPFVTFDRQGRAIASHVALDRFFRASAPPYFNTPFLGHGPSAALPDLTVTLTVDDDLVVFRGRTVDPTGQPLASQRLLIMGTHEGGSFRLDDETDENGGFAVIAAPLPPGTGVRLWLRADQPDARNAVAATRSLALAEPWLVRAGANNLGELRLHNAPVLVSGTLIVPDALASLSQVGLSCQERDGDRWKRLSGLVTRWLDGRRFEIRGEYTGDGPIRLEVDPGDNLPHQPVEFAPGTKDVEIQLAAAGEVNASMQVDLDGLESRLGAKLDAMDPEVQAQREAERQRTGYDRYALRQVGPGRLEARWNGLAAGRYRFTLECPGAAKPIATIDDILVAPDARQDPRLANIDLRSKLRFINIRLTTPDGPPDTHQDAQVYVASASGNHWRGHSPQDGVARILVSDRTDLRVVVPGYRFAHLHDVAEDREILLDVLPKIRVRVAWPFPLPDGVRAQLQLTPSVPGTTEQTRLRDRRRGPTRVDIRSRARVMLDNDNIAVFRPTFPTPHQLRLALSHAGRHRFFNAITPNTLVALDTTQPEVTLHVDAEPLRQALKHLRN
ncbi:MAG: hypothetical protein AAF628_22570 [Planctomycetota bacterium]